MITGLFKKLALVFPLLLAVGSLHAASITTVQRGVHDGFELVILNCDTLPDFNVEYDQVKGVIRLAIKQGRISNSAFKSLYAFRSRDVIDGVTVDRKTGIISFQAKGPVYLREHLVSGPPALILDFSHEPDHTGRYPFELDRDEYLRLGGRAERNGQLQLALSYVKHVREWRDDDANLIHRAGVIEHRLGQWDLALETFAKTAADPLLAADAHARRTMIYMAKGDTVASGEEWAGYFHRKEKRTEPAPQIDTTSIQQVAEVVRTVQPADTPIQRMRKQLPEVLQAGGGDSSTYLYYGWGMLAVGFVTIVGLWSASGKSRKYAADEAEVYHPLAPPEAQSEYEFLRALKAKEGNKPPQPKPVLLESLPPTTYVPKPVRFDTESQSPVRGESYAPQATNVVSAAPPPPLVEPSLASEANGISSRVVSAYQDAPKSREPLPVASFSGKIPIDQIIQLADEGRNQADIAHKLSVGRDEVAMVLNLAHLSRQREAH